MSRPDATDSINADRANLANADYRESALNIAQCRLHQARGDYANATTKRAKRDAAEDIEFWGNKAAYLAAWIAND